MESIDQFDEEWRFIGHQKTQDVLLAHHRFGHFLASYLILVANLDGKMVGCVHLFGQVNLGIEEKF